MKISACKPSHECYCGISRDYFSRNGILVKLEVLDILLKLCWSSSDSLRCFSSQMQGRWCSPLTTVSGKQAGLRRVAVPPGTATQQGGMLPSGRCLLRCFLRFVRNEIQKCSETGLWTEECCFQPGRCLTGPLETCSGCPYALLEWSHWPVSGLLLSLPQPFLPDLTAWASQRLLETKPMLLLLRFML